MKKQRQQRDMDRILRIPGIKKLADSFDNMLMKKMMPPEDYVGDPITDKISQFIDDFVIQLQDELDYVTKGKLTPTCTRIKDLICMMYHDRYGRHTPHFLKFEKSKVSDDYCCVRSSWRWNFKCFSNGTDYTECKREFNLGDYKNQDKILDQNVRDCLICHFSDINGFGTRQISNKLAKAHNWFTLC